MRREPLVYTVLLVAGLALAFRTWTHEQRSDLPDDSTQLWHERPEAIQSVLYAEGSRQLVMTRRGPDDAPYLWATQDTAEFRVDAGAGRNLLQSVAAPIAGRDLGAPDARARRAYGLDTSRTRLVVRFRAGTRELLLGARTVEQSGDRYVLETRSGHVYVLPALSLPQLTDAPQMFVDHRVHAFAPESVTTVTVRASGRTMTVHRLPPAGPNALGPATWTRAGGPEKADSALTAAMQQVNALAAATYAARANPQSMTPVLRLEYADRAGKSLGYLDLFQGAGAQGKPEYFARTELTGVLVRLYPGAGESVAAGLSPGR